MKNIYTSAVDVDAVYPVVGSTEGRTTKPAGAKRRGEDSRKIWVGDLVISPAV